MANTAALLQNLLRCKADYNYAVLQQTMWSSKMEANASKLSAQQSAEEKWYDAYDKATAVADGTEEKSIKFKYNGQNVEIKEGTAISTCEAYANTKVGQYKPDFLEEYSDLDTEYSLMVSTYDAMVAQLDAMITTYEEQVGTAATDTGKLQGG